MPTRSFLASFAACALTIAAAPLTASAHTVLVTPEPLTSNDGAKTGPCGCTFGSGTDICPPDYQITDVLQGGTITITWNETINHEGDFRVAFVAKAPEDVTVADFDDAAVQVTIPDDNPGGLVDIDFELPDTPCDNCTIQVRQFMDGADPPYYFTCAAVRLSTGGGQGGNGAGGGASEGGGSSARGGSSAGTGGNGSHGSDGEPTWAGPAEDDGCSVGASRERTSATGLLAVFGLLLGAGYRRVKRGAR